MLSAELAADSVRRSRIAAEVAADSLARSRRMVEDSGRYESEVALRRTQMEADLARSRLEREL